MFDRYYVLIEFHTTKGKKNESVNKNPHVFFFFRRNKIINNFTQTISDRRRGILFLLIFSRIDRFCLNPLDKFKNFHIYNYIFFSFTSIINL